MRLKVRVKPSSKVECVRETSPGQLDIRVGAPPEKGKANERVKELIAKHFGVSKSRVKILKGETSRDKIVEVIL